MTADLLCSKFQDTFKKPGSCTPAMPKGESVHMHVAYMTVRLRKYQKVILAQILAGDSQEFVRERLEPRAATSLGGQAEEGHDADETGDGTASREQHVPGSSSVLPWAFFEAELGQVMSSRVLDLGRCQTLYQGVHAVLAGEPRHTRAALLREKLHTYMRNNITL